MSETKASSTGLEFLQFAEWRGKKYFSLREKLLERRPMKRKFPLISDEKEKHVYEAWRVFLLQEKKKSVFFQKSYDNVKDNSNSFDNSSENLASLLGANSSLIGGTNLLKIIEKQQPTRIQFSAAELKRRNFWDFFHMQYQKLLEQRRFIENVPSAISPISKQNPDDENPGDESQDLMSVHSDNQSSMNPTGTDQDFDVQTENSEFAVSSSMTSQSTTFTSSLSSEKSSTDLYSFSGMHHIFEVKDPKKPSQLLKINRVKFANNDADLLAFSSSDGTIHIVGAKSKTLIRKLTGHTALINDFDWSATNEYILSVSFDKTIKIWDTNTGGIIRTIEVPQSSQKPAKTTNPASSPAQNTTTAPPPNLVHNNSSSSILSSSSNSTNANSSNLIIPTCCAFHPENNNIFLVGFSQGIVQIYNLSTGKPFPKPLNLSDAPLCICFTHTGNFFFVGDKSGFLYIYSCEFGASGGIGASSTLAVPIPGVSLNLKLSGPKSSKNSTKTEIKLLKKTPICRNSPITSLSFSMCWNIESKKANPSILLNSCDNRIRLLAFDSKNQQKPVIELASYPISQQRKNIRSQFCPLISSQKGAFFVSGSEAGHVFVFDLTKKENNSTKKSFVNQLMAHSLPALDVSWNYEETLLCSCSEDGTVVVWKNFDSKKEQ